MTNPAIDCCINEAPIAFASKRKSLRCITCWIKLAWTTMQERHALSQLDEDRLRDIGVNRLQARQEAERAPWDLPVERLEE